MTSTNKLSSIINIKHKEKILYSLDFYYLQFSYIRGTNGQILLSCQLHKIKDIKISNILENAILALLLNKKMFHKSIMKMIMVLRVLIHKSDLM